MAEDVSGSFWHLTRHRCRPDRWNKLDGTIVLLSAIDLILEIANAWGLIGTTPHTFEATHVTLCLQQCISHLLRRRRPQPLLPPCIPDAARAARAASEQVLEHALPHQHDAAQDAAAGATRDAVCTDPLACVLTCFPERAKHASSRRRLPSSRSQLSNLAILTFLVLVIFALLGVQVFCRRPIHAAAHPLVQRGSCSWLWLK